MSLRLAPALSGVEGVERANSSGAPALAAASARCIVFGYHEMGFACIEALLELGAPIAALFTHRDDPHEEIWWRSCAELAERRGIPVHAPDGVDESWASKIAAMKPAVVYSFSYRYLIPESILAIPPLGAYNLHPSMLPAYRGRAPINWMLVNGEREGGVTLHRMVARADAGDIVAQRAIAIAEDDTALTLYRKLVPIGAELVTEMHPRIVAGTAPRRTMDLSRGSYFGRRRPEDGRIDWNCPARQIYNLVRAVTHPYPGAFCFVAGKKLFVWEAQVAVASGKLGAPGAMIAERAGGAIEVAAGAGSAIVKRVQFEGDAEASPRETLGDGKFTFE
ncbi:MAG: formyltransferase [Candidatus Binataceae bacterium]